MIRAAIAALAFAAATSVAVADPLIAYVDPVVVSGGPDPAQAREFADALVRRGGMRARFADAGARPCGDDGTCLATRARGIGATIGLRLTIVEIGDQLVASILVAVADSAPIIVRRQVATGIDLGRPDESLVASLGVEPITQAPARPTRFRAALITGVIGVASASTGVYFGLRARAGWDEITRLSRDRGTWSEHYTQVEANAAQSERLAIVLMVAGTAGVVTAAVLWYVGSQRHREHHGLTVALTPDGAQASATWQF